MENKLTEEERDLLRDRLLSRESLTNNEVVALSTTQARMFLKYKILDNFLMLCREYYYVHDQPIVDDGTFDSLELWLRDIQQYYDFPKLMFAKSLGSSNIKDYTYYMGKAVKVKKEI